MHCTAARPHARRSSVSRAFGALLLVSISLAACDREPDKEWALEAYAEHEATIDEVHAGLQRAFERFAPIPYQDFPQGVEARKVFADAQAARRDAFDAAAFEILSAHPKIIGWEITYSFPATEKPPILYSFEELSRHTPTWRPGLVRPEKRDKLENGRRLSWGEFFIKGEERTTSLGMDVPNYHWGVEVWLPIETDKATLNASIFLVPKRNDEE